MIYMDFTTRHVTAVGFRTAMLESVAGMSTLCNFR